MHTNELVVFRGFKVSQNWGIRCHQGKMVEKQSASCRGKDGVTYITRFTFMILK